jgi:hypothetical protein
MILTGKLFKFRYAVDGVVQRPIVIAAENMTAADAEVMLHGERQAIEKLVQEQGPKVDFNGAHVRILESTEINLETF